MQIQDIQFDSEFNIKGVWWLPDKNNEVSGSLSYSVRDGIKLETSLTRDKNNNLIEFQKRYQPIIYGRLVSGLKVSLFECKQTHDYSLMDQNEKHISQKFYISTVFFGTFLKEEESQLNFKKMTVYFSHLEEWLSTGGVISDNRQSLQEKSKGDGFTLTYRRPTLPSFTIEEIGSKVELRSELKVPNKGWHHYSLVHKCSLTISPYKKKSFSWFSQIALDFENFLSLLSDTESQCTKMLLYTTDTKDNYVSVLHQIMNPIHRVEFLSSLEMIISFREIQESFEEILKLWFKKSNELRPVFDLFFSVRNNKNLYVQSQFLHLTQAIEIFHREIDPSTYLLDQDFETFKNTIKDTNEKWPFSQEFQTSFLNRLEHANEFSLRTRLKKIILSLDSKLSKEFFHDKNKFIQDVIYYRNKLTHHGPNKKDQLGKKLYYYNIKLSLLLSYLILTEIGIAKELVSQGLIRRRKYYFRTQNLGQ